MEAVESATSYKWEGASPPPPTHSTHAQTVALSGQAVQGGELWNSSPSIEVRPSALGDGGGRRAARLNGCHCGERHGDCQAAGIGPDRSTLTWGRPCPQVRLMPASSVGVGRGARTWGGR